MADSLHPKLKYSLSWAKSVVNQALDEHARVSESFLEFCGMSRNQLAILLASGRPEWALLRDLLKYGDYWAWKQEKLGISYGAEGTIQMWSGILHMKRHNLPKPMLHYLDKQVNRSEN